MIPVMEQSLRFQSSERNEKAQPPLFFFFHAPWWTTIIAHVQLNYGTLSIHHWDSEDGRGRVRAAALFSRYQCVDPVY